MTVNIQTAIMIFKYIIAVFHCSDTLLHSMFTQQASPNYRLEVAAVQQEPKTHLNTVTSAVTSAYMLEKRGWICILFPSKLDAWSEAGMELKGKGEKKANCPSGRWRRGIDVRSGEEPFGNYPSK